MTVVSLPVLSTLVDEEALDSKESRFRKIIRSLGTVVIGFSGGVDSTYLLAVSREVLGRDNVLAVIGISESYPERELREAVKLVEELDVEFETVRTEETDVVKFAENPPDRCYYCKSELFTKLTAIRDRLGFSFILDGTNADDLKEFRPGTRARTEKDVESPLAEAGLTKGEIRVLSARMGLRTADKPSFACLSSRFPYHTAIDREKLKRIDRAENILFDLGFRAMRVRYHDDRTARIEVASTDIARLASEAIRIAIVNELKSLGFTYVTLDMEGFRSGSMNEVLTPEEKRQYLTPSTDSHSA